jgi:hypothetical protein
MSIRMKLKMAIEEERDWLDYHVAIKGLRQLGRFKIVGQQKCEIVGNDNCLSQRVIWHIDTQHIDSI